MLLDARRLRVRDALFRSMLIGGLAAAAAASAAEDPKGDNTVSELVVIANRPPTVEELMVVARAECLPPKAEKGAVRPKIVSTYPQQNQQVRPGLLILRVTFDQPMSCAGFFTTPPDTKNPCSADEQNFLMSLDHKTIRVACVVPPQERYTLWLNGGGIHALPRFESLQAEPLGGYHITFSVSSAAPIQTIPDALSADPETVLADVYRPARRAKAGGAP
jgi:hypothetical protein